MPLIQSDYVAPKWLPGAHLQTVLAAKCFPRPKIEYRREFVELPDGDFLVFDWAKPEPLDPCAPIVVHFHGLEGSSRSHYAEVLMHAVAQRGWRGVVAHFRGCGGPPNRFLRSYFAGDINDCEWVLNFVHKRFVDAPMFAVGVSLGGNQLAKCLGDRPDRTSFLMAAASISAPVDLVAGSEVMRSGLNRLYAEMFLSTLREKMQEKEKRFPGQVDYAAAKRCHTLYDFDAVYTAPVHGFESAMQYWTKSSAKPSLKNVKTPLLLLNAKNDPFLPRWALPTEQDVSESVWLEQPEEGGHVGFPLGNPPGNLSFLPTRILKFFDDVREKRL